MQSQQKAASALLWLGEEVESLEIALLKAIGPDHRELLPFVARRAQAREQLRGLLLDPNQADGTALMQHFACKLAEEIGQVAKCFQPFFNEQGAGGPLVSARLSEVRALSEKFFSSANCCDHANQIKGPDQKSEGAEPQCG